MRVKILQDSRYEIDEDGKIFSVRTGKEIKTQITRDGYLTVKLGMVDGKRKRSRIHRLMITSFQGIDRPQMEVNHIDGNKRNNHISNLEWCSHQENMRHSALLKLRRGGKREDNPNFKITAEIALQIREDRLSGMSVDEVRKKHNVGKKAYYQVVNGKHFSVLGMDSITRGSKWQ
jgi:hypothetical protein